MSQHSQNLADKLMPLQGRRLQINTYLISDYADKFEDLAKDIAKKTGRHVSYSQICKMIVKDYLDRS